MKKRMILRIISLIMFVVAVVFVSAALANPGLGRVFYIGNFRVDSEVWHMFYNIYAIVMILLFVLSFFAGRPIGGIIGGIWKLLIFIPVLFIAFIMGAVLILEFTWWILLVCLIIGAGMGYGVYALFRLIDRKCGGDRE